MAQARWAPEYWAEICLACRVALSELEQAGERILLADCAGLDADAYVSAMETVEQLMEEIQTFQNQTLRERLLRIAAQ